MKLIHMQAGEHGLSVEVYREADGGFTVQLLGAPQGAPSTYSTDSECDALRTAQWMLGDAQVMATLHLRREAGELQEILQTVRCGTGAKL